MNEVTYLGHKCTDKGILPDDSKYSAIKNYPTPTDADSAKRFVAFCNYYRRLIKIFSDYSRHLTRLSKKGIPFEWTKECNNAFNHLKTALISPTQHNTQTSGNNFVLPQMQGNTLVVQYSPRNTTENIFQWPMPLKVSQGENRISLQLNKS